MNGSATYLLKRLSFGLMTVLIAITVNFGLFRALPGTAAADLSQVPRASPELKQALERQFGLDQPLWRQYGLYVNQLAHGNLGVSFDNQRPVSDNLFEALRNTVPMAGLGLATAIVFGIGVGTIAAWRRGTSLDRVSTSVTITLFSLPVQWVGLMLLVVFAGVFPSGGMRTPFLIGVGPWGQLKDQLHHMILPSLTLALTLYGSYALVVRSALLDTLGEDYVLTARAKGLAPLTILRAHALRNAMLPTVTMIALSAGRIVTGYILVETVFSWPGVGRAVYQAVLQRDYPMLQGAFLLLTVTVVASNLLADLVYVKLDPRVSS